jgi:hypothetical protein
MKLVDRQKALHHRARAESFLRGMRDLKALDDETYSAYGQALALLAVHAAISLADAVLVGYTGKRGNEQNHQVVLGHLRNLCHSQGIDDAGVTHLTWLLGKKTDFAYGDKRLGLAGEIKMAMLKVERFVTWASNGFPEIARDEDRL